MKKEANKKTWKKLTPREFQDEGNHNLDGQIIEFNPPLLIYGYEHEKEEIKDGRKVTVLPMFPTVQTKAALGRFMKVSGGFGSSFACGGRMIIGTFYETLKDVDNNKPFGHDDKRYNWSGNTKEYPIYVWVKR